MVYTTYKLVYMDIFTDGGFDSDFKKPWKREFLRTGSQQILFATPGKSIEVTLIVCYIWYIS